MQIAFAHLIFYLLYCVFAVVIGIYRIDMLYVVDVSQTYPMNALHATEIGLLTDVYFFVRRDDTVTKRKMRGLTLIRPRGDAQTMDDQWRVRPIGQRVTFTQAVDDDRRRSRRTSSPSSGSTLDVARSISKDDTVTCELSHPGNFETGERIDR